MICDTWGKSMWPSLGTSMGAVPVFLESWMLCSCSEHSNESWVVRVSELLPYVLSEQDLVTSLSV